MLFTSFHSFSNLFYHSSLFIFRNPLFPFRHLFFEFNFSQLNMKSDSYFGLLRRTWISYNFMVFKIYFLFSASKFLNSKFLNWPLTFKLSPLTWSSQFVHWVLVANLLPTFQAFITGIHYHFSYLHALSIFFVIGLRFSYRLMMSFLRKGITFLRFRGCKFVDFSLTVLRFFNSIIHQSSLFSWVGHKRFTFIINHHGNWLIFFMLLFQKYISTSVLSSWLRGILHRTDLSYPSHLSIAGFLLFLFQSQ